jgi:hypothetical protein
VALFIVAIELQALLCVICTGVRRYILPFISSVRYLIDPSCAKIIALPNILVAFALP